jgi:hypothetical protein
MLPEPLPSSAEAWHAQQNAQAHLDLLRESGALTAEEVWSVLGGKIW